MEQHHVEMTRVAEGQPSISAKIRALDAAGSVLAVINGEPGADAVGDVLMGASISAVNYSEVIRPWPARRAHRSLL